MLCNQPIRGVIIIEGKLIPVQLIQVALPASYSSVISGEKNVKA